VQDPLTHKTITAYDERNRPMSVKDALNNKTTFMYEAGGRKASISRPNGQTISFDSYDPMNRLLQQTVRQAPNPDAVTKYTYDLSGGMLQTMTDPNQNVYTYGYDNLNRKTSLTYPPDSGGQVRTETWTYDNPGLGLLQQFKNRVGNKETFTYDSLYRVTLSHWDDATTPDVTTGYDAASRITSITNSNSTITRTYYNDNLPKSETNTYGDGIARTVSYSYDPDGLRAGLTYPNNAYTFNYTYTGRGQLDLIQNGSATVADYAYDLAGNMASRTLDNSTSSTYGYDPVNRVTSISHSLAGTTRTLAYDYDSVGNRKWVKRDGARGDVYDYDLNDQVTTTKLDIANPDTTAPGPQTIVYDAGGNRSSFTAYGTPGYYSVNALNQYTSRSDTAPTPTPPPAPVITGQPSNQTVSAGEVATFSVAASGAAPLSYQWRKNGANISGATGTSYTTPATVPGDNGALFSVAVTNPGGTTLSNNATLTVQSSPPTITVQPLDTDVVVGQVARFSVTAGNATSYQWKKNGANISGATAASYTTPATTAADNGALFSVVISNAGGSVTSRSAKLTVHVAAPVFTPPEQVQGTHPPTQLVVTLKTSTAGGQMYYTLTGSGVTPTRSNGTPINSNYGKVTIPAGTGKVLEAFAYKSGLADSTITIGQYDTTDPQLAPVTPTPQSKTAPPATSSAEEAALGNGTASNPGHPQVTTATDKKTATVKRTAMSGFPAIRSASSDSDNHAEQATTSTATTEVITTAAVTAQATYDTNGNMTTGLDGSTYSYDAQNRLLSASKGGTTDTFLYDGLNRQIGKKIGTQALYYRVYDGWDLLGEYRTGTSNAIFAYLYGTSGIVKNVATNYYYYQDGSGSTSHIANSAGALKEYYRYDLHGQPMFFNASGTQLSDTVIGVRHLFTGQQWYNEVGLYDLRNRYYSPDIGRFLQSDPISFGGDATNLYRYCGNNSLTGFDPTGLSGTLTIYSNYGNVLVPGNTGHSWISFTSDNTGLTQFFGTYPNGMHFDDGYNSDVSRQTWIDDNAEASLFQHISYIESLSSSLASRLGWGTGQWSTINNCTAFATDAWAIATGEAIGNYNRAGIGSPSVVADSITQLNGGHEYAFHFSDGGNGYYFDDGSYGRYDNSGNGYYIWSPDGAPGEQIGVDTNGNAIYQGRPVSRGGGDPGGGGVDYGGINPTSGSGDPYLGYSHWGGSTQSRIPVLRRY